jgi:hypothetical protein
MPEEPEEDNRVEQETIEDDYTNFLVQLFSDLRAYCEREGFLWFDRCHIADFIAFAYKHSSGPPND